MSVDPRTLMDSAPRPWIWSGGYPQQITSVGPATLVAETFNDPDSAPHEAELICAAVNDYEILCEVESAARWFHERTCGCLISGDYCLLGQALSRVATEGA